MKRLTAMLLIMALAIAIVGCTERLPAATPGTEPTDAPTNPATTPSLPTTPTEPTTDETTDPTPPEATESTPTAPPSAPLPTEGTTPEIPTAPPVDAPSEPTLPDTTPGEEQELFDLLFDINNKIELRLDMTDAELSKMQADFDRYDRKGSKSPIYRKGDLYVTLTLANGEQLDYLIPEVGVRMKGNTSRTDFYNKQDGIYNIIHLKLSFQETFDDPSYYGSEAKKWEEQARKERKNRTFATLEKLDLRWNRCNDSSYLKEYFAYATYRQYGVPAPHTNLATLNWAGNHMGVFTINEPIDKVFLEKNLPASALGGDLYKLGWAGSNNASFTNLNSIGIENEDEGKFYAYDLKTNKKSSTHAALKQLITSLNSGGMSKEKLASLVDMDRFLPYCAVSYLLGNPDDLRNNYNNCYIYFRADNGKAVLIPYDYDRCLGVTTHWNPTGDGVTSDNPFGKTLLATGEEQRNPLFLYSIVKGGYYVREYADILRQIRNGDWFTYGNFAALYTKAVRNYGVHTQPGKHFHNAQGLNMSFSLDRSSDFSSNGNISFRDYLQAKLKTLDKYLAKVDENAEAKPPAVPNGWYIRADYTDWNKNDQHVLTQEGNLWVYEITMDRRFKLKIYNDIQSEWYGSECIDPNCTVTYETDGHTNIILPAGSYRISIDPDSNIITIEVK